MAYFKYWRHHEQGIDALTVTAHWVLAQAEARGFTLHDYVEGRCTLVQLGVRVDEASVSLKPLIPEAHEHYNAHGGSATKFEAWEDWFSTLLRNRIFYFFHKHKGSRTYRCWAEWPLPIPPRDEPDEAPAIDNKPYLVAAE